MDKTKFGTINYFDWDNSHIPEILTEIYLQKIYHPYLIGTDGIFLDLGLNIGLWSLYATSHAKQIYAFEPAKLNYDLACKNLQDNHILNVKTYQKAISTDDGKTTLYHSSNTTSNSLSYIINDTKEKEEVETIRLDTFVKQEKIEHIDLIKCDIEVTEEKLFASESFKNIVPITDKLVYEWHEWGVSNPNIINHGLIDLGFKHIKKLSSQAHVYMCSK